MALKDGKASQKQALDIYEAEVIERTHNSVLLSRQACLDAHDLNNLKPDSPLVSKRAKVLEPGVNVVEAKHSQVQDS